MDLDWDVGTISELIWWQPFKISITIVELFARLVLVLEVEFTMQRYLTKREKHHIFRLMARFHANYLCPPWEKHTWDVLMLFSLIGKEDLRRLGHVDMLIAIRPCHGHSRTWVRHGFGNRRSNLFWELVWIMHWWFKHQSTSLVHILKTVPHLGDTKSKVVADG